MSVEILQGDCREVMATLEPDSFDAAVTDPPYHLTSIVKRFGSANAAPAKSNGASGVYARSSAGFMGKQWDGGDVAFRPETWAEVLRVLKPGAFLLAFGGTRTYHRLACAIEDAGFEIRDTVMWIYGSGFNKIGYLSYKLEGQLCERLDGKNYYRDTGEEMRRQPPFRHPDADEVWGLAGALKPACEPIVVARKPLSESSVAANCLKWGCGALNIEASRVAADWANDPSKRGLGYGFTRKGDQTSHLYGPKTRAEYDTMKGRWPANVAHDGSTEVLQAFAKFGERTGAPEQWSRGQRENYGNVEIAPRTAGETFNGFGDTGTAARFFKACPWEPDELRFHYCSKADKDERCGSAHPTVKPLSLMLWLVGLVAPPGGKILDPFAGTGTTLVACDRLGFDALGIEQDAQSVADAHEKIRRFRARRAIGPVAERHETLPGQVEFEL